MNKRQLTTKTLPKKSSMYFFIAFSHLSTSKTWINSVLFYRFIMSPHRFVLSLNLKFDLDVQYTVEIVQMFNFAVSNPKITTKIFFSIFFSSTGTCVTGAVLTHAHDYFTAIWQVITSLASSWWRRKKYCQITYVMRYSQSKHTRYNWKSFNEIFIANIHSRLCKYLLYTQFINKLCSDDEREHKQSNGEK